MSFEGKTAVVTGAGGGLGAAYASALAQKGATVAVVDRTEALAAATAETIRKDNGNCHAFGADLSQWCDVEKCFHATLDRLGRIDILVNNAGGGSSSPGNASSIEKIEPSAWDLLVDANLTTAFLAIRAAAPAMKRQRYGKIVNIAYVRPGSPTRNSSSRRPMPAPRPPCSVSRGSRRVSWVRMV